MVYIFVCCIIVEILNLNYRMRLMQKSYLYWMEIGMPQANAFESTGFIYGYNTVSYYW
jgi:hypothetical protein